VFSGGQVLGYALASLVFARSPRRCEMVGGGLGVGERGLAMIGVGVTVALTGRHS
jgi:hypothetical protein